MDPISLTIRPNVARYLDHIAKYTGSDIFLLDAKTPDPDHMSASYVNGTDQSLDQRRRIAIYGDPESSEHAKTRVLIMIDQIVWTIDQPEKFADVGTAQADHRLYEARNRPTQHHLRPNPQEHPTDRIGYEHRHLLPSSLSSYLPLRASRSDQTGGG